MRMTADLGMLSAADADQLVTKARDFWKGQGYKIESFSLQAPTMIDNSQASPAPGKHHHSTVEADAHGYELALS
jgi:hypothetical protein